MKRDLDLVRDILIEIESWSANIQLKGVEIKGYSHDDVTYNAMLLYDAGYIDAVISKTMAGDSIYPKSLTWKGCEFLDEARDKTVWKKAKSVAEEAGASSLTIFRTILSKVAASRVDDVLSGFIN
ncbi:MAG: DUF2513 domain-containing protein [Cyanobacteria bacterium P01_A01_bin.116]